MLHPRRLASTGMALRRTMPPRGGCVQPARGGGERKQGGASPRTPPRGAAPWNPAKGGALGTPDRECGERKGACGHGVRAPVVTGALRHARTPPSAPHTPGHEVQRPLPLVGVQGAKPPGGVRGGAPPCFQPPERSAPCCQAAGSRLETAPCSFRECTERGRSSGVEHNLAKVGVEGSNPFARSSFLQENEAVKTVLRGRFLLPRPTRESWGSRGEAAESEKRRATGCRRHGGHPKATVCRLRDRRQWGMWRHTAKARLGRHRASPDAEAGPILLPRRR